MKKLEGNASIFCSNPGVNKYGILEPERLAPEYLKIKKSAVAPLPANSVDDTTDRIVSSSEEASWIVEGVSKAREATELNDAEPHSEPKRLARSFTLNGPFTLKNKKNAVVPLPASSVDDRTDGIVSSSEEA